MSKRGKIPPRPGSLEDRLIRKHGKFVGGILVNALIYLFTFSLIFYLLVVGFSAFVVINSASFFSPMLSDVLIVFAMLALLIYIAILFKKDPTEFPDFLNLYFSLQIAISIMAFIQVTIWMLDWERQIHEPRVAFLGAIALFLAYFRDQFTKIVLRLIKLKTDETEFINPNYETELPNI